eukprot:3022364-Lingulodinium_polyedra.AAC.1
MWAMGLQKAEQKFGPGPALANAQTQFWARDGAKQPAEQHFKGLCAIDGSMNKLVGEAVWRAAWAVIEVDEL